MFYAARVRQGERLVTSVATALALASTLAGRIGYADEPRIALADDGRLPTPREATAVAEAWRPWRAYAVMHLWKGSA